MSSIPIRLKSIALSPIFKFLHARSECKMDSGSQNSLSLELLAGSFLPRVEEKSDRPPIDMRGRLLHTNEKLLTDQYLFHLRGLLAIRGNEAAWLAHLFELLSRLSRLERLLAVIFFAGVRVLDHEMGTLRNIERLLAIFSITNMYVTV